jgi:integrase
MRAMPRRRAPPRLYCDPTRRDWVIRDGALFIRTGIAEADRAAAERRLAAYLSEKHQPERGPDPLVCDVLNIYAQEHVPYTATGRRHIAYHLGRLLQRWGAKRVSAVTPGACRDYAATSTSANTARRDLEVLKAAIRYYSKTTGIPLQAAIVLPPRPEPKQRWLTRSEVARLLWASRRCEHLRRFILIAIYTGSRSKNVFGLRWDMLDLVTGIMRRRPYGVHEHATKRAPPVRLGRRILAHLRRWKRLDDPRSPLVVHYNGRQITRTFSTTWPRAVAKAGLGKDVTPHVLRHSRASWILQRGVDPWQAAGHLGMSVGTLTRTYGHHSPAWQKDAAEV